MRFKCNKKLNKYFTYALALMLVAATLFSLTGCRHVNPTDQPGESEGPGSPIESEAVIAPPDISGTPDPNDKPGGDAVASPEPSSDLIYVEAPDLALRDAADDDFFADAAFMGNSLMDGFRMFSGLTTCDYYAATSMSVVGVSSTNCIALDNGKTGTILQGITQKPYGKIYILLGINEIGMNVDSFIESYGKLIDSIREAQTKCDIYIMGLTPVSYAKSSSSDTFNMTRIKKYNDALYELASEKGCYYLNLVEAIADDTGYLPSSETTDGVHFSAKVYTKWLEYVRTHYA